MKPIVKLNDIHKTYQMGDIDVPVLKGVSLTVARGEMVALMGSSGSGKSTLMNLLGCLDRPNSGSYWLDGEEVAQLSANQRALLRNRKLGFVFQNFNLLPRTSALDNVAMPLLYAAGHISERNARQRATEMLGLVGLKDRLNYEPSRLSGGQQQRVAIARALVNRPAIVLADEPTGNLDSHTTLEVLSLFQQLNREGLTLVLVTHETEVARYASRLVELRDGRVCRDETIAAPRDAATDLAALPVENEI